MFLPGLYHKDEDSGLLLVLQVLFIEGVMCVEETSGVLKMSLVLNLLERLTMEGRLGQLYKEKLMEKYGDDASSTLKMF